MKISFFVRFLIFCPLITLLLSILIAYYYDVNDLFVFLPITFSVGVLLSLCVGFFNREKLRKELFLYYVIDVFWQYIPLLLFCTFFWLIDDVSDPSKIVFIVLLMVYFVVLIILFSSKNKLLNNSSQTIKVRRKSGEVIFVKPGETIVNINDFFITNKYYELHGGEFVSIKGEDEIIPLTFYSAFPYPLQGIDLNGYL